MGRAVAPVEQAIGTWRSLLEAMVAYSRIKNILARATVEQTMTLPEPRGKLTVDAASWVPPGSREAFLKNIALSLEPGEALGIIGPSASGKTSLAKLLVGVWPPALGNVRLDGADLSAWNPEDRGRHIGYLPQDVELFNASVKANIARLQDVEDHQVVEAAQLAGAHDVILGLPEGYDTQVGSGGLPLSGGQRQRIGFARALFGNPRLVVLDEPNAHLDQAGEHILMEALRGLKERGTTVVVIAQRTAILGKMDKILLLRDGKVDTYGKTEDVLEELSQKLKKVTSLRGHRGPNLGGAG
jgi:PrtD family type I secretion system ABC transporter